MSRRARHLSLALAALVAGTAVALAASAGAPVAAAPPSTASLTAVDYAWVAPGDGNTATIAVGGTVTFGYPSGDSTHNVNFSGSSPTSCTQTAGPDVGPVPPLPAIPSGQGWSGTCRFDAPGSYPFVCGLHSSMTGRVDVVDPTATTPAPPAGTGPVESTPGSGPGGSSSPSAPARVHVAHRQRGVVLHGTVTTPAGPSLIGVTASSSNRALAKHRPKRVRQVRVGATRKRSTGTAKTSFAVTLAKVARRALHRRHRLVVDLRITVTPPGGRAVVTKVAVVLRDR